MQDKVMLAEEDDIDGFAVVMNASFADVRGIRLGNELGNLPVMLIENHDMAMQIRIDKGADVLERDEALDGNTEVLTPLVHAV